MPEFTEQELNFIMTQIHNGDYTNFYDGGMDTVGEGLRDKVVDKIALHLYPEITERPVEDGDPRVNWYWY
ncbi:hypothetical protein SEA_NICEHOUSE_180 [Rhodococcus phage NiceHouse]|nr:hypothetical protein SEA_NICEHOUSE_180 [Rhodococcus phage NiceHouse]